MLQVIPQLIARIDTPRQLVGRLIHQLLTDIGKHHPQVTRSCVTVSLLSPKITVLTVSSACRPLRVKLQMTYTDTIGNRTGMVYRGDL